MSDNPFDLTGRTALVTGGAVGIGRGLATSLARAGADLVAVVREADADSSRLVEEVAAMGRACDVVEADLMDREQVLALPGRLDEAGVAVDVLVNNAGIIRRAPAAEHSDADWDDVLNLNLDTPFLLSREFGRRMIERGSGRIVFIASMLSFQGGILVPGYTASKSAIAGLTKALANEWAATGVTVNAIAPGYIATANTAALRADEGRSAAILGRIPMGRWGDPADLGGTAVFLASDAASYVTGVVLPVDGGWLAR